MYGLVVTRVRQGVLPESPARPRMWEQSHSARCTLNRDRRHSEDQRPSTNSDSEPSHPSLCLILQRPKGHHRSNPLIEYWPVKCQAHPIRSFQAIDGVLSTTHRQEAQSTARRIGRLDKYNLSTQSRADRQVNGRDGRYGQRSASTCADLKIGSVVLAILAPRLASTSTVAAMIMRMMTGLMMKKMH
jgi:hypothetical protein